MVNRLYNARNIMAVSGAVSFLGVAGNIIWALQGNQASFEYNALLFLIGVTSAVCYWLAGKSESDSLTAYAWIAGVAFGAMLIIDCKRGEEWEHLFWIYEFGVFSLVFLASSRRALWFSLISCSIGLVTGFLSGGIVRAGGYAARPLVMWLGSATIRARFSKLEEAEMYMRAYLDAKREARREA